MPPSRSPAPGPAGPHGARRTGPRDTKEGGATGESLAPSTDPAPDVNVRRCARRNRRSRVMGLRRMGSLPQCTAGVLSGYEAKHWSSFKFH